MEQAQIQSPAIHRPETARVMLAGSMITVGILHFLRSSQFVQIVPLALPHPLLLVYISGICEIIGGVGLLIPAVSTAAAWGLIILFVAVFPANINQAVNHIAIEGVPDIPVLYWLRLPLQAVLIAWAGRYTRKLQTTQISNG
jgi:uncharacterized membrane protein